MKSLPKLPETYCGPGLFDLQLNGFAGFDFNSPSEEWSVGALVRVKKELARHGILSALPTLITDDRAATLKKAKAFSTILASEPALESSFLGLHIEGPFICPEDGPRGAHSARHCCVPDVTPGFIEELQKASRGRVRLLTLAAELQGAMKLIATASSTGIVVAIGHTSASDEIIECAVRAGVRLSTHLGNGSHEVLPCLNNYIQTQLADDRLSASFIADGHHIPYTALKNFIRAKTPTKSILISDATAAATMTPGTYSLGGEEIILSDDFRVSKPGQRNLAGSALSLDKAVLNVHLHCGVPFETAWSMASINPAKLLNLPPRDIVTVDIGENGMSLIAG